MSSFDEYAAGTRKYSSGSDSSQSARTGLLAGRRARKAGELSGGEAIRESKQQALQAQLQADAPISQAEIRKSADVMNQQAMANLAGQQQAVGQNVLAGGPLAAVSGRGALLQQQLGGEMAEAGALSTAAATQQALDSKAQDRERADALLARERDIARENRMMVADSLMKFISSASASDA